MRDIEQEIDNQALGAILALVYKHTGITMTEKKKALLQGRLRPRLQELELGTYQEYLTVLGSNPKEAQEFINLVTTNETFFFRTQRVWDFFNKDFLPKWTEKSIGKKLHIWSAASSSGEEAYSIAMLCRELLARQPAFSYQIVGSDISTEVLATAERGQYEGRSIADLKTRLPQFYTKYFTPVGDGAQVKSELKTNLSFRKHSLFDVPRDRDFFEIVFLRNVMIYFSASDQEKVLKNIITALVPGGYLILGESESLARFDTPLQFVEPLVYRKPGGV